MRKIVYWFSTNDQRAALYIFQNWRNRKIEKILSWLTHFGDSWCTILAMIVLTCLTAFDWRGLLALTVSHCIVQIIKRSISRARPYDKNNEIILCGIPLKDYSFPSGHTNAAFTVATAFSFTFPLLSVLFFSIAAIVAFSRVYLGFHYPTDVMIGSLIGTCSTIAVFII